MVFEFLFVSQSDWSVQEGRRGSDDNAVSTESFNSLLGLGNASFEVSFPDVTARDETERKSELGVPQGGNGSIELLRCTIEINVKSLNGKRLDIVQVGVETTEVGSKSDFDAFSGFREFL